MKLTQIGIVSMLSVAGSLSPAITCAQGAATPGPFVWEAATPAVRVAVEAQVVKNAPFSAEIVSESIQPLSDGNRIVQRSSTRFYRDRDGGVRREEDRGNGNTAISIIDPVAGTSISLDPNRRTAWTMPHMASFKVAHASNAMPNQMLVTPGVPLWTTGSYVDVIRVSGDPRLEQLPERTIEGVRAQGVRRPTTIAAGAIGNDLPIEIVSEEWTSPDLKVLLLTEHRDPRIGTSTYRVTNIVRTEPDRYLFEVPPDYTVSQSPVMQRLATGSGRGAAPQPAPPVK
jgi:hypothetical protein